MNTSTEQACHDLIADQGRVIAELEAERDKFKQFYINSSEERAKLIVHLTNHVPVREELQALRNAVRKSQAAMRLAIDWATTENDSLSRLAEEVCPALNEAIQVGTEALGDRA